MKIEDRKRKGDCFGQIMEGTAFSFDRRLYIKTDELRMMDGGSIVNAIRLHNGEPVFFDEFDEVFLPDCKVIVEEEL